MPHFIIVFVLYIKLLNLSWIKMSIFEEYEAFNGDASDKSSGIQLNEPPCLQRGPSGVN